MLNAALKTATNVTAYVKAKVLRRDLHAELRRLEDLPTMRAHIEVSVTMSILLALALFAASFGWVGLAAYFAIILVVFY